MRKYFFPLFLVGLMTLVSACTQDGLDCREASACSLLRDKVDGIGYSLEDSVQATALYGKDTGQQAQEWAEQIEFPSSHQVSAKAKQTWVSAKSKVPVVRQEVSRWRFDPQVLPLAWHQFKQDYLP